MIAVFVAHGSGGQVAEGLVDSCQAGELVLPSFPIQGATANNRFIGLMTNQEAQIATVSEQDLDPDLLEAVLIENYPGLPQSYLSEFLVACLYVARQALQQYGPTAKYRALVGDGVSLQEIDDGGILQVLSADDHHSILTTAT